MFEEVKDIVDFEEEKFMKNVEEKEPRTAELSFRIEDRKRLSLVPKSSMVGPALQTLESEQNDEGEDFVGYLDKSMASGQRRNSEGDKTDMVIPE